MSDLIERLRAAATGPDGLSSNVGNALLREAAAALEAEASEVERRGLERAAEVARSFAKEPARKLLSKNMNGRWPVTAKPLALQALRLEKAIRALIPEAPAQRKLGSTSENKLSRSKVGLPAPAREDD